jgi:putative transcriptional regulator
MRTNKQRAKNSKSTRPGKRSLFHELSSGVAAMKAHREGRLTLRSHKVASVPVPAVDAKIILETRSAFKMSRQVFARKLRVNARTLERWEQGRSRPNDQAAILIWLLRLFPDTLERLEHLPRSA